MKVYGCSLVGFLRWPPVATSLLLVCNCATSTNSYHRFVVQNLHLVLLCLRIVEYFPVFVYGFVFREGVRE